MRFNIFYKLPVMRLLLLLVALCASSPGFAQVFNFKIREASDKKTAREIKAHNGMFDTIIVRQDKWDEMAANAGTWANNLQFKSVHAFVKFYVDPTYPVKIYDPYTFRLTYKIYGYANMADTNAYTAFTDTLTISYKPDSLATFQDMQVKKYSNFHKIMIVMTGLYEITGANDPPVPVNLDSTGSFSRLNFIVEGTIQVQPFHKKVKVNNSYVDVYLPLPPQLKTGSTLEGDNLKVRWNLNAANLTDNLELTPVNYELEWTYIDNYKVNANGSLSTVPVGDLAYCFKNNSTRISVDTNVYKIPLIYQQGYLVYRVRMVRPDAALYKYPVYGAWSLPDSGAFNSLPAAGWFALQAHLKDSINWQYTVSFAEQGKYKQVLSYYDGMLKNRQSITRFNSRADKLIATEQIYDYEGRPSISILPTPVSTEAFRYQHNLSLNAATAKPYKAQDFDYINLALCPKDQMPSPLAMSALAYIYYSPQNPDKTGFQKFVPDAGGYPFVQTLYSPGYDERVEKQGGAGDSLQIGTNHHVKNDYVSAEQMDLNRMFGLDIGWSGFYRKTVSRDPNGQLSLNITDYKGKTVSSAMIGIPDTLVHAIVPNANVPDVTPYSEDFVQGMPQQIMGNKKILDKLFFNDAAGNATSQYKVNLSPFPTFCPGKYLNVAMSYDYKIVDECGDTVAAQAGILGQTGVSSSGLQTAYASAVYPFFMEQGKHSLHKELTLNTDEVGRATDLFMALPPAQNCLRTEQSFIKEEVLSKTFPCPENYQSMDCNTCDNKKYEMMQELWPNKDSVYVKRKYGIYRKDIGYVEGNDNSIFTLIKGIQGSYYRYQDSCLTLPASITRFGHTYTNLRDLPVDTFIAIFNDTIAEALLPLHPEYCKLLECSDDLFEDKLRSIPDAKVAAALGLLKLGDIIAADPLFAKMQTLPANYPSAFDTLAHTMSGTLSLDTIALVQAYCNCGDTLMLRECYEHMFQGQIAAAILLNDYVKARYFQIITNLYIGNRRRYLFNLNLGPGQTGGCTTCDQRRMSLVPQPVFIDTYNPNGALATGGSSFLGILQNSNPAGASQLQQYNSFLFNADSLNAAQDSAINIYNANSIALCAAPVDQIMVQLANCADPTTLLNVRNSLLALCNSGQVANGAYSPEQIRAALVSNGISLDDLCNPYLVNYDNTMAPAAGLGNGNFICNNDAFYTDAGTFLSTHALGLLKNPGTSQTITLAASSNQFEQHMITALGAGSITGTAKHSTAQKLYTLYLYNSSQDTVKLFFRTASTGSCVNAFTENPGETITLKIDCINNVPFGSFANGYVGKYLFAATVKHTNGSQVTQCVLPAWTNTIEMNNEGENKLAGCVPCTQLRSLYTEFRDTLLAYQVKGIDHPYYRTMLRNFMNLKLKKAFTTGQYEEVITSCALADSMLIKINYGQIVLVFNNGMADVFLNQINSLDSNIQLYTDRDRTPWSESMHIDLSQVPAAKRRTYRNFIAAYTSGVLDKRMNFANGDDLMGIIYMPYSSSFVMDNNTIFGAGSPNTPGYVQVDAEHWNGTAFVPGWFYAIYNNPAATFAQNSYYSHVLAQYLVTHNFPGYSYLPAFLSTVNAQYTLPEKKAYLNRAYSYQQLPANKVLDSLQPQFLQTAGALSGKILSYGHPARPGNIEHLYVADPATATVGTRYQKLDEILTAVKTYFSQNTGTPGLFFTGSPTRQIQPNNRLTAFRCRDSAFWFRHFDAGDTLYNVFIRIPKYVDTMYLPGYRLDGFTFNPGEGNSYSFKVSLSHNDPNVPLYKLELDGYTDFVVAKNMMLENVLLAHPVNGSIAVADTVNNCERQLLNAAILEGRIKYQMYVDSVRDRLYADCYNHFMDTGTHENLFVGYRNQRFNYTLYYYDRAGNLVRTVPPAGAAALAGNNLLPVNAARANNASDPSLLPDHHKASNYAYNSLNQVVNQTTPDGGRTEYFYDAAGRAIFSQNEKQRPLGYMTYTLYDKQGRIMETGQSKIACAPYFAPSAVPVSNPCSYHDVANGLYTPFAPVVFNLKSLNHTDVVQYVRSLSRSEVVLTHYDTAAVNLASTPGMAPQDNLRKRVSTIRYFDYLEPMDTAFLNYNYGMHFSYDIAGNVKTLVRDYPAWKQLGHQFKRIDYDYDVISGKVNLLSYNRSFADQFYQRYSYDADNRITQVETSQDGYIWKRDAAYAYYQHGPLARMSLGDLRVQGVDYAYTIQGWLKAINGDMLDTAKDMRGDGRRDSIHARDAVALSLDYFKGDYKPIGTTPVTNITALAKNMYNGNIPRATTAILPFPDLSSSYTYDQLNRLVKTDYAGLNRATAQLTNTADYYSSYAYDADGNLQKLVRNGNKPATQRMDSLVYRYASNQYNNKLQNVNDYAANNYQNDITQHTNAALSRYLYDPTGNTIKDLVSGQDTIKWNHYNKVTQTRNDAAGNGLAFAYDGAGNRYLKTLYGGAADTSTEKSDYYVRDAQGNILAVYKNESRYVMTQQQWIEYFTTEMAQLCGLDTYVDHLIGPYFGQNGSFKGTVLMEVASDPVWLSAQLDAKPVSFFMTQKPIRLNTVYGVNDQKAFYQQLANFSLSYSLPVFGDGLSELAASDPRKVKGLYSALLRRNDAVRSQVLGLLCERAPGLMERTMEDYGFVTQGSCNATVDYLDAQFEEPGNNPGYFMELLNNNGLRSPYASQYKSFLQVLFAPATQLQTGDGPQSAYELLCQQAPDLLTHTMQQLQIDAGNDCADKVGELVVNPGTNPNALYNFMDQLVKTGNEEFREEYANFCKALISDNSLVVTEEPVPLIVLEQLSVYKGKTVKQFMQSHSLFYEENDHAKNAELLQELLANDAGTFQDFIDVISDDAEHGPLLQALCTMDTIIQDNYYTGTNGRLIPYFQEAIELYHQKQPTNSGLFWDYGSGNRALMTASNEQSMLVSAVYDGNPAAFLKSYATHTGNPDIVNKALHNIADLSLGSFAGKIKESMITSVWCTVTVVDSIVHNAYVNALQYQRLSLSSHHLYGSSRLGTRDYPGGQYYTLWDNSGPQPVKDTVTLNSRRPWYSSEYNDNISSLSLSPYGMTDQSAYAVQHQIGNKQYELSNHLGNVQATVTDNRTFGIVEGDSVKMYKPVIAAAYDYYPFGMLMPDRYVSDTTAKCVTVTQSKWVTKKVLQCYNVTNWIWPGYIHWGSGKATKIEEAGNPDNNGILVEVNATGGVQFEFEVAADADNEFQLETAELSGSAATVSCFELIGGQQVPLGSFALSQANQTIKVSIKPTTTKVYTSITGGTTGTAVKIKQLCKWVPVMVQETILVDVCDGDKDRYRFGFNGQEKVNEWSGVGNFMEFSERGYDSRIGRFLRVDPIANQYPWNSTYSFAENRVIDGIDLEGQKFTPFMSLYISRTSQSYAGITTFNKDVLKGVVKNTVAAIGGITEIFGQGHYSNRMTEQNKAIHFTQTNGKNLGNLGAEMVAAPVIAVRDVIDDPSNGENWGALGFMLLSLKGAAKYTPWESVKKSGIEVKHGSGPARGVTEVSDRYKSTKNFQKFNGQGTEYVFDTKRKIFVFGRIKEGKGSPHQRLVNSIQSEHGSHIVGGTMSRQKDGTFIFSENSGHFGENWTNENRGAFSKFIEEKSGIKVNNVGYQPEKK